MNKKSKKLLFLGLAILLLILLVFAVEKGLFGNKNQSFNNNGSSIDAKAMKIIAIALSNTSQFIEINDEIEPKEVYTLSFPVSGTVEKINCEDGEYVKKGTIIAKLDTSEREYSLIENEKNLKLARVSGTSIDVQLYEKKRDQILKYLEYSVLKAPFDGYIANFSLQINQTISGGAEFGKLYDLSSYKAVVNIDETEISLVKAGNEVFMEFNAFKGKQIKGKVVKIYRYFVTEDEVIMFPVEIYIGELGDDFKPGLSFSGKIIYGQIAGKIIIPKFSVDKDDKGNYVALVKDDGRAYKQYVEIESETNNEYVIASGLSVNDKILAVNMIGKKKTGNFFGRRPGQGGPSH